MGSYDFKGGVARPCWAPSQSGDIVNKLYGYRLFACVQFEISIQAALVLIGWSLCKRKSNEAVNTIRHQVRISCLRPETRVSDASRVWINLFQNKCCRDCFWRGRALRISSDISRGNVNWPASSTPKWLALEHLIWNELTILLGCTWFLTNYHSRIRTLMAHDTYYPAHSSCLGNVCHYLGPELSKHN